MPEGWSNWEQEARVVDCAYVGGGYGGKIIESAIMDMGICFFSFPISGCSGSK
jgi:hypothetical protein